MGSEDERHTSQDLAEHLNASKIASMSMTERSDIIKQILDASTVNVPTLGRRETPRSAFLQHVQGLVPRSLWQRW